MGEAVMQDGLTGALTDPFQSIHMGVTAENVATRYGISRAEQDALALESQRRAGNAIAQGYFRDQIVPVEVTVKRKPASFETDEFVRADASAEALAKLKPVFVKEGAVPAGQHQKRGVVGKGGADV